MWETLVVRHALCVRLAPFTQGLVGFLQLSVRNVSLELILFKLEAVCVQRVQHVIPRQLLLHTAPKTSILLLVVVLVAMREVDSFVLCVTLGSSRRPSVARVWLAVLGPMPQVLVVLPVLFVTLGSIKLGVGSNSVYSAGLASLALELACLSVPCVRLAHTAPKPIIPAQAVSIVQQGVTVRPQVGVLVRPVLLGRISLPLGRRRGVPIALLANIRLC